MGFEAHRDEDLKKMRKGTTLAKNEEVVRILHANNIQVAGNFILHQDYSEDDFKQAADYIRNLEVDTPSFSIWTPLPGTEIYEDEKDNLIIHDFDFYDLFHTVLPTKLPLKQFYSVFARNLVQTTSPAKKRAAIEQIAPEDRLKFFNMMSQLIRRLENLYQDYDQSLW